MATTPTTPAAPTTKKAPTADAPVRSPIATARHRSNGVDVVLADLDGVVYAGAGALPHAAVESLVAPATGRALGYITNNASRTDVSVAGHL